MLQKQITTSLLAYNNTHLLPYSSGGQVCIRPPWANTTVLAGLSGVFRGEGLSSPLQLQGCLHSLTAARFVHIPSQPRSLTPSVPPRSRPPDHRWGGFPLEDFDEIEPTWMMQAALPGVCPWSCLQGPLCHVVPESKLTLLAARQASNPDGLLGQGTAT